ncbi:J domain-containing protein [Gymnodinialimonas hymeniacidonis]|uniref:J domain-containing protein n=1 Tax=Gymnodinialimonas hymeniacidonis TaxID=3126508 RepID=UPI0034C645E9
MKIELEQAFATLGVPASASASDVRSAYRSLIRQNHPDHVAGDTTAATHRLAEINAAKDLIDRSPAPTIAQPSRTPPKQAQADQSAPLTAEQQRARREAEARAFRKAMETRAHADLEAERRARAAADRRSSAREKAEAQRRVEEEARRERQAAFAAALRGTTETPSPVSILGRLRALGSRTSAGA